MNLLDARLSADGGVQLTVAGDVATVSLVRAETRNAQVPATWRALAAVRDHLDPTVRVVIIEAEGKSFSAGIDLRMLNPQGTGIAGEPSLFDLTALDDAGFDAVIAAFQEAFLWWRDAGVVSIAAVNGHAVGAGFQLALAADLIVVADDAKFCMREPQLGLVPDLGGTGPLVAAVGYSRALEICATGRWIEASEAVELGLAMEVVERSELAARVRQLATTICAAPAGAVAETKALLRGASVRTHREQAVAERAAQRRRVLDLAAIMAGSAQQE